MKPHDLPNCICRLSAGALEVVKRERGCGTTGSAGHFCHKKLYDVNRVGVNAFLGCQLRTDRAAGRPRGIGAGGDQALSLIQFWRCRGRAALQCLASRNVMPACGGL